MQVDDLDTVAPGIAKIAAKRRLQSQTVLFLHFLAHLIQLLLIAHDESEMTDPVRLNLLHFENGEKLVLTQFQKSVAFATIHFLQIKDVFIKFYRRFYVIHFDREVVASINLHAHECIVTELEYAREYERSHPGFRHQTPAANDGLPRDQHAGADSLLVGRPLLGGASRQGSDRGGWCGRQFHDDSVGADANARCWHNHAHLASGRTKRSTSSRARLQPILRHVINCGGSVGHL